MQLPPARPRGPRQGRGAGRRRHPDGVQHDRDLGRDHDGNRGDEDFAGQPRGDRRFDRADCARISVRRRGGAVGLRQDDPRLRDGAGPARRSGGDALWRVDNAGALARPGRDDPGRVRGGGGVRRRRAERRGPARAGGLCEPRRRRLRRPVHRQHDGLRVRGSGDLPRRLLDGPRRGRRQGAGRRADRRAGDAVAERGPSPEPHHHPRVA
jgi:hypothetical protein